MIRTFLFDMGNVLTRFSHARMCRQIGGLCGLSEESTRQLLIDSGLQWEFERGRISEAEFGDLLSERVGRQLNIEELSQAASDIFEPIEDMERIVRTLKLRGYRLVLLSNTSFSHFNWIQRQYSFLEPFDDFVVSFQAGAIKPEAGIYEAALRMINCLPEQAFYTDDIPEYVMRGREYGFQAEVFTGPDNLLQQLDQRGIRLT